jgi:hypothetical protein
MAARSRSTGSTVRTKMRAADREDPLLLTTRLRGP